jgi:hypothetical protein
MLARMQCSYEECLLPSCALLTFHTFLFTPDYAGWITDSEKKVSEEIELLREVRDLLLVIAEPSLAKRDEKLRSALRKIVGKGKFRAKAVPLMDGSRNQAAIRKESGIDAGDLSRLVKALREASLISKDDNPKMVTRIPVDFFEKED